LAQQHLKSNYALSCFLPTEGISREGIIAF